MAVLQAEVERIKRENHRLRDMLDQVNTSYNALKMHIMKLMQDQKDEGDTQEHKREPEHEAFEGRTKEKKQIGNSRGAIVPRQFMDLGLASMNAEPDSEGPSLSSCQDRSGSPGNNVEVASRESGKGNETEDGDKIPKSSAPNNKVDDQVEATMRKTRVSVRARSEAPMVRQSN